MELLSILGPVFARTDRLVAAADEKMNIIWSNREGEPKNFSPDKLRLPDSSELALPVTSSAVAQYCDGFSAPAAVEITVLENCGEAKYLIQFYTCEDIERLSDRSEHLLFRTNYLGNIRSELSQPAIHIIDETIRKVSKVSPNGAWLTATLGTMKTGLYQRHAKDSGYNFDIADYQTQVDIHDVTDLVKAGKIEEAGKKFRPIIEGLWKIKEQPIVGACTEIPIAYAATGLDPKMHISSLDALADGCVRELYGVELY